MPLTAESRLPLSRSVVENNKSAKSPTNKQRRQGTTELARIFALCGSSRFFFFVCLFVCLFVWEKKGGYDNKPVGLEVARGTTVRTQLLEAGHELDEAVAVEEEEAVAEDEEEEVVMRFKTDSLMA